MTAITGQFWDPCLTARRRRWRSWSWRWWRYATMGRTGVKSWPLRSAWQERTPNSSQAYGGGGDLHTNGHYILFYIQIALCQNYARLCSIMPIMPILCQLCFMLRPCYYANSYAGIIHSPQSSSCQRVLSEIEPDASRTRERDPSRIPAGSIDLTHMTQIEP